MKQVAIIDWNQIDYREAWDRQTAYHQSLIHQKRLVRDGKGDKCLVHKLIFCEHPHVYTLGKSGDEHHLLMGEKERMDQSVSFYKINRGGDITYHGPGQLVVYPILDLDEFYTDVHRYVRMLEEVVIRVLDDYGLEGIRTKNYTGVWLGALADKPLRKICAIGVHLSRWVSLHGLAFNINTDLNYFGGIVPCGIEDDDKAVSSLQVELGRKVDLQEVKLRMTKHFEELFCFDYINTL